MVGRKISRIRELSGMKQEALAFELGISRLLEAEKERIAYLEKLLKGII